MIFLDKRAGSIELHSYLRYCGADVTLGMYDADVEWVGNTESGPAPCGAEYKELTECLTAMSDGRLTGTQLPRMQQSYARSYLIIEGPTRISDDGILEWSPRPGRWEGAFGRKGEGWTAREFYGRIASIEEFFGVRVLQTHNIRDTAARIYYLYKWWSKQWHEHASYKQWDQSTHTGPKLNAANILIPTSQLPLAQRMAREISNVGQLKAGYVAKEFATPAAMVMGLRANSNGYKAAREMAEQHLKRGWANVEWVEELKKGGRKTKHFGPESIKRIITELWG